MSADQDRIEAAAQFLLQAHHRRDPFGPIPDLIAPRDVAETYAVQEAFQGLQSNSKGGIAGYKIAATTRVMQQLLGLNEPLSGAILAKTIHDSPAVLRSEDYSHLGVECEIAVQIGEDITPAAAPYRRHVIDRYVQAVMPAFELIDDRHADYAHLSRLLLPGIADNAWNAGVVVGSALEDWQQIDLAAVQGALYINRTLAGEGRGADVMGHPFEALTWLANHFAKRGKTVQKGAIVMTGSVIATKFVSPGDEVSFRAERLGEVHARVQQA